jgi:transcriptional regulator of arginine metabolism
MAKKDRLEKIKSLINEYEISTQEELTEMLNKEGYDVSQATVSRDINKLNLVKAEGLQKKTKYILSSAEKSNVSDKIIDLFKQITLSISSVNNLIIVKTLNGNGNSAGMAIDKMNFSEVLGTIAGDDTLLVVTKSEADANFIVKSLRML